MTQAAPTLATLVAETTDLTREQWLALRRLGGSDAATVAGLNPYKSRYALWVDLVNGVDGDFDNEAMAWGRRLEPVIADAFAERTGLEVVAFPYLVAHPTYPHMTANVDRLVLSDADAPELLEIKTTGRHLGTRWDDGNVPDYYQLQGQHYLAVTGLPAVWFCVLVGGQAMPEPVRVERDDELIGDLIELEADFWRLVEAKTPPAVDGSESTLDALKRRFEPDPGSIVELDADVVALIGARNTMKASAKALDDDIAELDAQIMEALGTHEIGTHDGTTVVTWKQSSRTSVDSKALAAAHPDIAKAFERTSTYRRFLPKGVEA